MHPPFVAALISVASLGCGGGEVTQVLLEVDADDSLKTDAVGLCVDVWSGGDVGGDPIFSKCGRVNGAGADIELPTTISFVQREGSEAFVARAGLLDASAWTARAQDMAFSPFVEQTLRFRYEPDRLARRELRLVEACRMVPCSAGETCRAGACTPSIDAVADGGS